MGKIKGWKKINDISWKSEETGALTQVVPMGNLKNRTYHLYVEARNVPIKKRSRVIGLTKAKATDVAIKFMKQHPRG